MKTKSVVLVGSPDLIGKNLISKEKRLTERQLATDTIGEFIERTLRNVHQILGMRCEIIDTGRVISDVSKKEASLLRNRIVNLAPNCFDLGDSGLRYVNMDISRAVFYGATSSPKLDRIGIAGRGEVLDSQLKKLTAEITPNERLVLMDDRASENGDTLKDVKELIEKETKAKVEGFIVGHYGGVGKNKSENVTKLHGLPLVASEYRFESIDEKKQAGKTISPAEELLDLTYFQGGGEALLKGYPEYRDLITKLRRSLDEFIFSIGSCKIETLIADLSKFGIVVKNLSKLEEFLSGKKQISSPISAKDLQMLLSEKSSIFIGDGFNPKLIENRRIPLMWPGDRAKKSFWNMFGETDELWLEFSAEQLDNTFRVVKKLERAGVYVSADKIPALELPQVNVIIGNRKGKVSEIILTLRDQLNHILEKNQKKVANY